MASMLESSETWKSAEMVQAILKARAHMSLGSADELSQPQGKTRVALFGLGNVRDERLGRMFQTPGSIEWQDSQN